MIIEYKRQGIKFRANLSISEDCSAIKIEETIVDGKSAFSISCNQDSDWEVNETIKVEKIS